MRALLVLLAACGQDHMSSEAMVRPSEPKPVVQLRKVNETCTPTGPRCEEPATCVEGRCRLPAPN